MWRSPATAVTGFRHSTGRMLPVICALVVASGSLAGQETGTVVGMVLDQADLHPVSGARVSLPGHTLQAHTDAEGRFRLFNVPAGEVMMRIEGDGYVTFIETIAIAPLEESLIHFHLDRLAAVLDQLLVDVPHPVDRARGHSEAQVSGESGDARTAADLLISVPGLTVQSRQGRAGEGVRIRLRGVSSFVGNEEPHIYVDGARIDAGGLDGAMLTLAAIPAASVVRIRVLRGPASTSLYPDAAAGVILVETMGPPG